MKPPAPFRLSPVDGFITITAGYTPSVNIHDPDSIYCRYYWLPEIGPSAYLLFVLANAWMPDGDDASITVNYDELAHSVGTAPGRLAKSLQRLAGFHLAHTLPDQPSTLYLKRRAPTLNDNQLARLAQRCPTAAACHDDLRHVA